MQTLTLETDSAAATEGLAGTLAARLAPGDLVVVSGDVGAGKTTFVRGACRALGVTDRVTSPSFTIGRLYRGKVPVSHIDLFRLETLSGEDPGLLSEYLAPDTITFVEWPDAAFGLDPERIVLRVRMEHLGGDRRRIVATPAA